MIINVSHPCIHSFGGGAASSVSGRGRGGACGEREQAAHRGWGREDTRPRPTLELPRLALGGEREGRETAERVAFFTVDTAHPVTGRDW